MNREQPLLAFRVILACSVEITANETWINQFSVKDFIFKDSIFGLQDVTKIFLALICVLVFLVTFENKDLHINFLQLYWIQSGLQWQFCNAFCLQLGLLWSVRIVSWWFSASWRQRALCWVQGSQLLCHPGRKPFSWWHWAENSNKHKSALHMFVRFLSLLPALL